MCSLQPNKSIEETIRKWSGRLSRAATQWAQNLRHLGAFEIHMSTCWFLPENIRSMQVGGVCFEDWAIFVCFIRYWEWRNKVWPFSTCSRYFIPFPQNASFHSVGRVFCIIKNKSIDFGMCVNIFRYVYLHNTWIRRRGNAEVNNKHQKMKESRCFRLKIIFNGEQSTLNTI